MSAILCIILLAYLQDDLSGLYTYVCIYHVIIICIYKTCVPPGGSCGPGDPEEP